MDSILLSSDNKNNKISKTINRLNTANHKKIGWFMHEDTQDTPQFNKIEPISNQIISPVPEKK